MKHHVILITFLFLFSGLSLANQHNTSNAKIYVKEQISERIAFLITSEQQEVLDANIIDADLVFPSNNPLCNISNLFFLKTEKRISSFSSKKALIESPQFVDAINTSFRLKTEDDALKLRSLLFAIDNETKGKIFKKDKKWCVVKQEWFDDLDFYEVTTDSKGRIIAIDNKKEKMQIPDGAMGDRSNILYEKIKKELSDNEIAVVRAELNKSSASLDIKLTPLTINGLAHDTKLYNLKIEISKTENDVTELSIYTYILLSYNDKYSIAKGKGDLLTDDLFMESIVQQYSIKNETGAAQFEILLDNLNPVDDLTVKTFFKRENVWCFVRDKSFEDLEGVLVLCSENGKILYVDRLRKIDDAAILKMKAKDPDFKLDFAFKMETPTVGDINIGIDQIVPVKINFNADAVNATGAYIMTQIGGKMSGFSSSTTMESPFTDDISGECLAKIGGKGPHELKYMLLPPGKNVDNPYASITLNVTVAGAETFKKASVDVDAFVQRVFGVIKSRKVKEFEVLCINKERIEVIINSIVSNTSKDNGIKAELNTFNITEIHEKAYNSIKQLQDDLTKQRSDISNLKFVGYEKKDFKLVMPGFQAMDIGFRIKAGILSYVVSMKLFVTNDDIFIFDLKYSNT